MEELSRAEQLEQKRSFWKQHIDRWQETGLTNDHGAGETLAKDETILIAAHSRKKRERKPLTKDLPRTDINHDIVDILRLSLKVRKGVSF